MIEYNDNKLLLFHLLAVPTRIQIVIRDPFTIAHTLIRQRYAEDAMRLCSMLVALLLLFSRHVTT